MLVLDTSALVSLAVADTLEDLFDEFDVRTTEKEIEELEATAAYDDPHGTGAAAVLGRDGEPTVHEVDVPTFGSSRIDEGEASCVAICERLDPAFLITDDLRALPELQALVRPRVAISPVVLRALVERERIDDKEARARLQRLAATRDWLGAPIYRRAERLFEE